MNQTIVSVSPARSGVKEESMHIVIAEPLGISEDILENLTADLKAKGWELTAYDSRPKDQADLGDRLAGAEVAVIANYPLKEEALAKADALRFLSVAFTGVDHIALDVCKEKGIAVSNCAGYSTESVSELAISMALALLRFLPACGDAVRGGKTAAGLTGRELGGRTFGIIGTGAIGMRTAELARAFGCEVIAYSRTKKDNFIHYESLETVMEASDVISVHVPLNDATRGLIGEKEIALMKPSALFINTARGPIVDNGALAKALKEGRIAGAGIDVYEMEPPIPADHPLLSAPHTILTPHVGFATEEAMRRRAVLVFDNIRQWAEGKQQNVIC